MKTLLYTNMKISRAGLSDFLCQMNKCRYMNPKGGAWMVYAAWEAIDV